jgi:hypothetical protein
MRDVYIQLINNGKVDLSILFAHYVNAGGIATAQEFPTLLQRWMAIGGRNILDVYRYAMIEYKINILFTESNKGIAI